MYHNIETKLSEKINNNLEISTSHHLSFAMTRLRVTRMKVVDCIKAFSFFSLYPNSAKWMMRRMKCN